ncbi:hypothetical protein [Deinococcus peraridilitoris]|uniref:Uncharacterized protein n=1 Tax=Deinococcus peraridilitoris (strain DSM 19664 / LMG 22246 / CIP 109416 / KR-200) TaxID=937777 RepID=K9ZYB4_DEIPD|nr:hypothetical protein [Deinococcus peraridilitoris]AFZ65745.1 hypothetical protein Deipe_0137 [Deinococcus peraridilitoris DSM 19664]
MKLTDLSFPTRLHVSQHGHDFTYRIRSLEELQEKLKPDPKQVAGIKVVGVEYFGRSFRWSCWSWI